MQGELLVANVIDENTRDEIIDKFSELMGEKVIFTDTLEPELIGGFVVRIDGKVFDCSVKRQLEGFRAYLGSVEGV